MIYQIIDFVLFFLVLYLVLPGTMVVAVLIRDFIHQNNRGHAGRHKQMVGKPSG